MLRVTDRLRLYFRQIRDAVVTRLLDVVFNADDTPNKYWMAFAKRTFMGRDL
jgi:actin related protein 2/3 complex subunit 3